MATGLFLTGCLAVLGGTFVLGVIAGRLWPRSPAASSETMAKASREASATRTLDRSGRPLEPAPALTFYHELTAPLTAPPPARPPKPARPDRADRAEAAPKPERAALPEPPTSAAAAFTVQVAAYKAKEPAEALRARLSAAGLDAYVFQIDVTTGARFRVRVGSFTTRDAAQHVADRIGREQALSAFVTSR
jgi:cell division protein FtsN